MKPQVFQNSAANVAMENRVTIPDGDEHAASKSPPAGQVPPGTAARARLRLVSNKLARGSNSQTTTALNDPDGVANTTEWSAMRPQVTGESRNCRVCKSSTDTRMSLAPIFNFQYLILLTAGLIAAGLLSLSLSSQLPLMPAITTTIDPTLKIFIYLFGGIALVYFAILLRKPVRSLEFDKNAGVFWLEKRRLFGWKVGESAQMPISQVYALQLLNYSNHLHQHCNELNVVFRNGTRVNLINHNNTKAIHSDAGALGTFLNVPIWGLTENTKI